MNHRSISTHLCHAKGCTTAVPPKLLMCVKHWRKVSKPTQALIWRHYRPGQEIDKRPTREYLAAAKTAIEEVAAKEFEKPRSPLFDLVACAICGCTEDQACPGGCYWIEDPAGLMRDICSACEEKAKTQ